MQPGLTGIGRLALCALLGVGLAACDSPSAPPQPAALVAAAGDVQSGIAGFALGVRPGVRVEDASGRPVADVPVTFAVLEGGGTIEFATATTDPTGTASPGSWVLGPRVGIHVLTATVDGLPAVRFTATAIPGAPAILRVHAGGAQSTTVGNQVSVTPTVRVLDANENPVPGAPVTFTVASGDGLLSGGSANGTASSTTVTLVTDATGAAAPTAWQLGTKAGLNLLEARVAGLREVASFVATGEPGPAAALAAIGGGLQTVVVGSEVPVAPTVRVTDTYGNPVPGVGVTFTVLDGGGTVGPGPGAATALAHTVATNAAGLASLGAWQLGTRTEVNRVAAHAEGIEGEAMFDALAAPGAAAAVNRHAGDLQAAAAGSSVAIDPAVQVSDAWGNAVPGVLVTFTVTGGGGALSGAIKTTDVDGVARIDAWNLGPVPGPNSIEARVAGLVPVQFNATGTPGTGGAGGSGGSGGGGTGGAGGGTPTGFTIDMRYTTSLPPSQLASFNAAADRWAGAITGDLPDVFVSVSAGGCGAPHPAVNETIDDVVIFVVVKPIDGPGQVLGSAGPCRIRSSSLPALGIIFLDADDLDGIEARGLLQDVIVHEMGHVLGIGTLWPSGLLTGAGTADPIFTGATAVASFLGAGGSGYSGTPVPVENTGGGGTRDAHWRESVLASEIMTGWINYGGNPVSAITIGSLQDMGYAVDLSAADGFQMTGLTSLGLDDPRPAVRMLERSLPAPIVVTGAANARSATAPAGLITAGIVARHRATRR